ncbi:cytochrome P450 [Alkalinema sp. FACHB-956]|uniref:cytochrome P450 n=1 Tax=Alkalinema sp. FACHB-956 TaxID=2692768 RepID=UPI001683DAB1|nr:cytochrome P450 [Alkalinema sp. FACHB-956]MBD2326540.1 cytochrome P450 [Alkalinema sp. FACHB-956]
MTPFPLPPGRKGLPIIGETLEFARNPNYIADRYAEYGPIFSTRFAGKPAAFMVGPTALEFILSSGMDHLTWGDGWPQPFRLLLGRSLFLQDGAEHRRNRKLLMPAFYGAALARYLETMEAIVQQYLYRWEQQQQLQWFPEFKRFTFEVASNIFLGVETGSDNQRLSTLFTQLSDGFFSFINLPGTKLNRGLAARRKILTYVNQVVNQRRKNPTNDALSLLLQATDETGDRLSQEEICNHAILMLFAGHETTTAMLTWSVLELGRHPEILQTLRTEQEALGKAPLTLEALQQMPALDRFLLEIERCHPPVGGGFRGVVQGFDFNGYHVPAGWLVQYSIAYTHQLPELYPEPERFNPDRWLEDKPKPFGLVGFGGGSRICLGLAFAKMEMKLVLAHLLRDYEWQLLPHQNLDPMIIPVCRPKDGCRVTFQRRSMHKS